MKTRSQALFAYLQQAGVLHDTPEAIALAKAEYRKQYKKRWAQQRQPRKEIRVEFTLPQYQSIKIAATKNETNTTAYVRSVVLRSVGEGMADKRLLEALQLVSMATIAASQDVRTQRLFKLLSKAEGLLLAFIE